MGEEIADPGHFILVSPVPLEDSSYDDAAILN